MVKIDQKNIGKEAEIRERDPGDVYKLKGRYINDPGVLEAMPADVLYSAKEKYGSISLAEYEEAREDVKKRIEETAKGILGGEININPLDEGVLKCNFCSYKSICKRDKEYPRNYARKLPPKPAESKDSKDSKDPKASQK